MKKIFLMEEDADLFAVLKYNLEKEGLVVRGLQTSRNALAVCQRAGPDLLLLDISKPDLDGLEILRRIRSSSDLSGVPVILLSSRASETDRVMGLNAGANDYMVKPFSVRELIARIGVQLRDPRTPGRFLCAGNIKIDRSRRQTRLNGTLLKLTATEFRLLEYLISHPGEVFNREQLLNAAWGEDRAITDRIVDVYIVRLRKKIEVEQARPRLIHSVHGFGYTFEPRMNPSDLKAKRGEILDYRTCSSCGSRQFSIDNHAPDEERSPDAGSNTD